MAKPSDRSAADLGGGELTERSLADRFLEHVDELPALPREVSRVIELCNDPMTTMGQFDQVFVQDPALASKVLRLVNSAYFSLPRPVASISRAVAFLGFTAVRAIALSVGITDTLRPALSAATWDAWWSHSIVVSEAARQVADIVRIGTPDDAQTSGLFHDIAEFLVPLYFPMEADLVGLPSARCDDIEREQAAWGVDHAELGAQLLTKWGLPASVVDGVRFHHGPNEEIRAHPSALAIHVAEQLIARWDGEGSSSADPCPLFLPASEGVLSAFATEFEKLEEIVRHRVEESRRLLG
jgi:putative nucleotidyltransferase with HDIG domain